MSFEYVRRFYRVPVKRGTRVRPKGSDRVFIVTGCCHYVHARPAGHKTSNKIYRFHPTDVDYRNRGYKQWFISGEPHNG